MLAWIREVRVFILMPKNGVDRKANASRVPLERA